MARNAAAATPYITHPVAVATILAGIGADDPTVCAGLLHDVVEDTPCTLAALRSEFGDEITDMVDGPTALDAMPAGRPGFPGADAGAMIGALGDERVLAVIVADRLHNMRTLRYIPHEKQVLKARQTLEISMPMAHALSMDAIGSELHSLAATTLALHQRPRMASGRVLAAAVTLLPASARDRWREEWLAVVMWVLRSEDRTDRLARLIGAFRDPPPGRR